MSGGRGTPGRALALQAGKTVADGVTGLAVRVRRPLEEGACDLGH